MKFRVEYHTGGSWEEEARFVSLNEALVFKLKQQEWHSKRIIRIIEVHYEN